MTLREYLSKYRIPPTQFAKLLGVTRGVVLRWMDSGVPKSRRADVVAVTEGAVTFKDAATPLEDAGNRIRAAMLMLEDYQVRLDDRAERVKLQLILEVLNKAVLIVEGKKIERRRRKSF